jgi:hypothetical protein
MVWPFALKKSRKVWRISALVFIRSIGVFECVAPGPGAAKRAFKQGKEGFQNGASQSLDTPQRPDSGATLR